MLGVVYFIYMPGGIYGKSISGNLSGQNRINEDRQILGLAAKYKKDGRFCS